MSNNQKWGVRILNGPHTTKEIGLWEQSHIPHLIRLYDEDVAKQKAFLLSDLGYEAEAAPVPDALVKAQGRHVQQVIRPIMQARKTSDGDNDNDV